jgi:glycosyltransferase involved in cell wall biosynthesis
MPQLAQDSRPGLAIVTNSITPYHVNLQRLIADGIPELKLHVLITHASGDFKWSVDIPPQIHVDQFGAPQEHPLDNPLRRPVWDWKKGGRMIQYFRQHNVRVAIINGYKFISYLRLMNYCDRAGIPFFVNSDSNIRSEPELSLVKRTGKRAVYGWWMKRVAGVMSMGEFGDQFFLKYGADPNRLYRVPYWPNYEEFAGADEVQLARFCSRFGLNRQRRRLLFSGRLVPVKRVDLLIDAFAEIAASRPEWDLLIVGDGALREQLQDRVPPGLRSRVTWTGFLAGQELALAYHAADVLVLPSDHEPWALVVQEAMAAGLVVVASDVVGAAKELIVDGISGRIFERGSRESLSQSLEDVTHPDHIDAYKTKAAHSLREYREQVDPVAEVRRAILDTGSGLIERRNTAGEEAVAP